MRRLITWLKHRSAAQHVADLEAELSKLIASRDAINEEIADVAIRLLEARDRLGLQAD